VTHNADLIRQARAQLDAVETLAARVPGVTLAGITVSARSLPRIDLSVAGDPHDRVAGVDAYAAVLGCGTHADRAHRLDWYETDGGAWDGVPVSVRAALPAGTLTVSVTA
jgi:hypothetical protein